MKVIHLSTVTRHVGITITSTACRRETLGSDGNNSTDVAADVTCKLCRRVIAGREYQRALATISAGGRQ